MHPVVRHFDRPLRRARHMIWYALGGVDVKRNGNDLAFKEHLLARAGAGEAIAVGLATIVVVALLATATHALVSGVQTSEVWRIGALVAVGGLILLALRPARAGRLAVRQAQDATRWGVRRHRRLVPKQRTTTLTTLDGRAIAARIIDVSLGGVAVEACMTERDFAAVARVGSRAAGPVRRTATGAVFTFTVLLDPVLVNENLVL